MNDLSNMPPSPRCSTPSGFLMAPVKLPSPWGDGAVVYGHQTASGAVYDESGNLLGHI